MEYRKNTQLSTAWSYTRLSITYICLWYKTVIHLVHNSVDSCSSCSVLRSRKKEEKNQLRLCFYLIFTGNRTVIFISRLLHAVDIRMISQNGMCPRFVIEFPRGQHGQNSVPASQANQEVA